MESVRGGGSGLLEIENKQSKATRKYWFAAVLRRFLSREDCRGISRCYRCFEYFHIWASETLPSPFLPWRRVSLSVWKSAYNNYLCSLLCCVQRDEHREWFSVSEDSIACTAISIERPTTTEKILENCVTYDSCHNNFLHNLPGNRGNANLIRSGWDGVWHESRSRSFP